MFIHLYTKYEQKRVGVPISKHLTILQKLKATC